MTPALPALQHPAPAALSPARLVQLAQAHATPLWVYDAATLRARVEQLRQFDTIRFAQKACSNTHVLRLLRGLGVQVDAVSAGEIERALHAGYDAHAEHSGLVFTADEIDRATLALVGAHGIPVNAGSVAMLEQLGQALGAAARGHRVWLRINPGFGHGHSRKTNTGGEHSKHGIWPTDVPAALATIARHGLRLVGLHMHIGSGVDYDHLAQVCEAMVRQVGEVAALGHDVTAISAGGGLSVPYRAGEAPVDTAHYFSLWDTARRRIADTLGHAVRLEIEPGRFLVAESGVLVAEVRAVKDMGRQHFVLCDAGFNDLVRPAMYGGHHAISVIAGGDAGRATNDVGGGGAGHVGAREATGHSARDPVATRHGAGPGPAPGAGDGAPAAVPTVVAGPLCESGDVFTQGADGVVEPRLVMPAQVGDLLVFHDTGAYGAAMSSNYNTRPLAPEVLVDGDTARLIRRRQTVRELIALEELD